MKHTWPELTNRISTRLSILPLGMGFLSLALSLSFFLTLAACFLQRIASSATALFDTQPPRVGEYMTNNPTLMANDTLVVEELWAT